MARIGRPDILWSVNKLTRSITKWTKACDKRLNRLISYIHHTSEYKQYCHVGNIAKQCRLGLFQDSDFAGDLEDSKSTSGGTLCIFGSHTFVPTSWMCKKQTSVSHSSTESEIVSLDTGLRLDGLSVLKLKEQERAAFFSPSENWCLPASTLKPEEREFVVDSGASMHMISKKDLSKAEMDTLTKSCSPTIVITANGEVQRHEEATVHVKELDIFLTMKVLDNTPAVLSLGKPCDENGYSYEWINGQKPHLIKDGIRIICNTENFVPIVFPGLSSSSSGSSSTLRTPMKQESHSSSSSSSSSPTVGNSGSRTGRCD